jgi:hypothetical protein
VANFYDSLLLYGRALKETMEMSGKKYANILLY